MSMIRGMRTVFTPGTSGVPVAQQAPNPAPQMPNTFAYLQRMGPAQVPPPQQQQQQQQHQQHQQQHAQQLSQQIPQQHHQQQHQQQPQQQQHAQQIPQQLSQQHHQQHPQLPQQLPQQHTQQLPQQLQQQLPQQHTQQHTQQLPQQPQQQQSRPQSDKTNGKPRAAQADPNAEQKSSTKSEGRVSKKSDRRGRPKKISDDLTQKMIRLLENSNDDLSLEELGHAVGVDGVHLQTIRNYMVKEGYCKRIACQQKWLTNQVRDTRMQYALAHQRWQNEWRSVLFSDCVNFGLGTTRKAKVFNRKDERLCEECLQSREGIDKSIFYCWAMVGYDYKSPLVFLNTEDADHPVLSQHDYISQVLQPNVQPIASVKRFVYLDTGSTAGQAPGQNLVHAYLESVHIPYLRNPEASPDLNIFKDVMLILKKRLQKRSIGDKIQLKIAVLEEWDKITTKEINKLVDSMKPRMEKLLARKGMPL